MRTPKTIEYVKTNYTFKGDLQVKYKGSRTQGRIMRMNFVLNVGNFTLGKVIKMAIIRMKGDQNYDQFKVCNMKSLAMKFVVYDTYTATIPTFPNVEVRNDTLLIDAKTIQKHVDLKQLQS